MQEFVYEVDARLSQHHWWFVGRRKLFARMIRQLDLPAAAPVLDVGTSAGTNLRMLRDLGFSDITGLDNSIEAIRFCAAQGLATVRHGDISAMPFADGSFSLVLATDVIEHIDDDVHALAEIRRVLRPGTHALVSVPAFPALWGFQDEVSLHRRRYRMRPLLERVRRAGLVPRRQFHFNYLLFAPLWVARQAMKIWRPAGLRSESEVNTPLVNRVLTAIFDLDIETAPRLAPPFGASIVVLAERV